MSTTSDRRRFLQQLASALAVVPGLSLTNPAFGNVVPAAVTSVAVPPTRVITRGPRHHWFGYYDKLQFDPTSRYVLGMEVPFEHRSPRPDDEIQIGMVDLEDDDRWISLGQSTAWNWQQGCMLQWLPGSDSTVL